VPASEGRDAGSPATARCLRLVKAESGEPELDCPMQRVPIASPFRAVFGDTPRESQVPPTGNWPSLALSALSKAAARPFS
jgi:hypothetical protein